MKIISLVLKFLPEHAATIVSLIEAVPGASVPLDNGDGRLIVLIEDGEGYSTADSIIRVHQVPHLMSVTLAYEYTDDDLAPEALDFAALRAVPHTAINSAADAAATHLEKLEA
jgi:nitrate reductase NapD